MISICAKRAPLVHRDIGRFRPINGHCQMLTNMNTDCFEGFEAFRAFNNHKIKYVQLYYLSIKFNGFEKPTVQLHCNNKTIV